jgi:carbonic anhydrase
MRLLEAIIDANHRAINGDKSAALSPKDYGDSLPIAALTCIDPRLNPLFPGIMGLRAEDFIWLRNAGNILTSPLSSTMRSLSLACVIKGAKEIAIIGHTDCQVCKTSVMQLMDRFKLLGIDRSQLPANLVEYFGLFASERQNIMKSVEIARKSPLIGPKIPIHGLLVDISTGKLEWVVNGYLISTTSTVPPSQLPQNIQSVSKIAESIIEEVVDVSKEVGQEALQENKDFLEKWKAQVKVVPSKVVGKKAIKIK